MTKGPAEPIYSYTSDGCSMWPDKFLGVDYCICCEFHDDAYWRGGTWWERLVADSELLPCIANKYKSEWGTFGLLFGWPWAVIMWIGVRLGGGPWFPVPWRWGYGHKYFTPYTGLY